MGVCFLICFLVFTNDKYDIAYIGNTHVHSLHTMGLYLRTKRLIFIQLFYDWQFKYEDCPTKS